MKGCKDEMKRLAIALAVLAIMLMPLAYAAADESTMQGQCSVSNVPPTCGITSPANGSSHAVGSSISFAVSASDNNGDALTYWWNFGDGSDNVYGANATHSYSTAGTYLVRLTVSDNYENVSTSISVTVTSASEQESSPGSSPGPGSGPTGDWVAPTLSVLSPSRTEVGRHLTVRVSVSDASGVDQASIVVKLDNSPVEFTFSNGVIVLCLSDLEPGDHVLQVIAADLNGNSGERTVSFTVNPEIAVIQLGVVTAGQSVEADLTALGAPVRRIVLLPSQGLENALVNVRELGERPADLPPPPGAAFAYLEISIDVEIENATIEFAVPRAWCEGNGVSGGTIRLYRYSSGWQELRTARIGENATHVFYSASTQGFSIFAITAQAPSSALKPEGVPVVPLVALVVIVCAGAVLSLFATGKLRLSEASRGVLGRRLGRKRGSRGKRVQAKKILIFAAFVLLMLAVLLALPLVGAAENAISGTTTVQNAPPTVTITSPAQGAQVQTGVAVSFQATASDPNNTPVTYSWDFGDGWTSSESSITHSYSTAGTYTIQLTVSDGQLTATDSVGITVRSPTDNAPTETVPPTLTVLSPLENEVQKDVVVKISATDNSGINSSSIIAKLDDRSVTFTFSDSVITVNLTDLALGSHQVRVNVVDLAGNWAEKIVSFTAVPPPPVVVQLSSLVAGENVAADFSASGTPVRGVVLLPAASRASASVSLRMLAGRPAELPYPPGVALAYLELSTDAAIGNATIEFALPRSWLVQNSIGENTVKLYRYSEGGWQEAPTTKVGENSAYLFYSAVSPGLSTFAITGQQVSPVRYMTFTLSLPTDPITGSQAPITLRVVNPTSLALSKQFKLRIGGAYEVPISVEVGAGQTTDIPVTLNVAGLEAKTYGVELVDVEEGRTLASGQMTFGASQGEGPPTAPAAPFPILPLAVGLAIGVPLVTVAVLGATGRIDLAKLKFWGPTVRRPSVRRVGVRRAPMKPPAAIPKPPRGQEKRLRAISRMLKTESELGADYLRHLAPIAKELAGAKAAPTRIQHRGKPVTPFRIKKAGHRA